MDKMSQLMFMWQSLTFDLKNIKLLIWHMSHHTYEHFINMKTNIEESSAPCSLK